MKRFYSLSAVLLVLAIIGLVLPLFAQSDEQIITVAAPQFFEDAIQSAIVDFQAENPGVKVIYLPSDAGWSNPSAFLEGHLEGVEEYTRAADVLFVSDLQVAPAGTRAGFFLDMSPLVDNDPTLDIPDFYPAMWQSFQWDGGIWAIPISGSLTVVLYDRAKFDAAGLFYPDENWTLREFEDAARTLTEYDSEGNIAVPGGELTNIELTFRALLGRGFYDPNELPNPPRFTDSDLIDLAELWLEVQQTGVLGPFFGIDYDGDDVPLRLGDVTQLAESSLIGSGNDDLAGALLPGGVAGLSPLGFAISAGTDEPELAYEFIKFMTSYNDVANLIFSLTPARRSMKGQPVDGGIFGGFNVTYSPENQTFVDVAFENALPNSELRFADYLNDTIAQVTSGSVSVLEGLTQAEERAVTDLQTAEDYATDRDPLIVATPVPTPVLAPGEISLKFGLNLFTQDIPNEAEWDRMVQEFSRSSATVGNVELIPPSFGIGLGDNTAEYDCYYEPFNSVPNVDLATILSFDPFMDTDTDFDRSDFVGDSMQQMMRENRTWGYPLVIQPEILWYDSAAFANAGVPVPDTGWSTEQFTEALDFLKFVMEEPDDPTFVPETFDNTYIMMLIAAFGGVPYDYRTSPPTLALTDPTNLEAITQVLNLAKDGYIGYQRLGPDEDVQNVLFESSGLAPIFTDTLNVFNFRLNQRGDDPELQDYRLTNYPTGASYSPLSYTIGTAYISAESRDPEACYEWIDFIAQRPDLLSGLPARLSQINDPDLQAAQGEDIVTLYLNYVDLINDPNAIVFPNQITSGNFAIGPLLESLWINRAFDNYVFDDADLEADLREAELFIGEYRTCSADIPQFDINQVENLTDIIESVRGYAECAVRVDPTLEPLFGPLLG